MQSPSVSAVVAGPVRLLWLLFAVWLLAGCAGASLDDYADRAPELIPAQFFTGELSARGVVKDYVGTVIRTFDADISASWDDDGTGTLDEVFRFDDGEVQTRTWTLTPVDDGYRATAGDVVEPGLMQWRGNAIHMNYVLRLAYGDGTLDVRMDDWMYLVTPDTLINETTLSKWGIDVGEILLVIQKR
ncbi:DUF3833 domain-containing protein [Marinobacter apostichopi]|uniref:DUF3833 domain-containing protein n=1 Tax=Marinobacter apostichopi TaxID=3035454 RepID=UPI002572A67D|nr:DUF3833 domain-containing protein [Marinobacter sp. LA51]